MGTLKLKAPLGGSVSFVGQDSALDTTIVVPTGDATMATSEALAASFGAGLVGYLSDDTNAAVNTVKGKLQQVWLTPADFLGTASVAIQAALNTGKNVHIPEGMTYLLSTPVLMKASGQVLQIDGTLKANAAMPFVVESTNFDRVGIIGGGTIDCNSLAVSGIHFSTSQAATTGIYCRDILIKNAAGPWSGFTAGILFDSVGGKAGGNRHKNVSIDGVTVKSCLDHGVLVAYADSVSVQNNVFDMLGFHGHESVNCTDVSIIGNTARDCGESGLGVGDGCSNWTISNNVVRNCGGDGSITCEHNSIIGVISGNTVFNAKTQGINISFGTPGVAPFEKLRDITVVNNILFANQANGTTHTGINAYSSTVPGVGEGVNICNNVINGFNAGITYYYFTDGSISNNTVLNLAGENSLMIQVMMVSRVNIEGNSCNSNTGDHAIKLLSYAGTDSDRVNVCGNHTLTCAAATKSVVFIEGNGFHSVSGNETSGALHYLTCSGAAEVVVGDNYGNLASTAFSGGTQNSILGSANATTVGVAGGANALPATPKGYVTVFVPDIGQVKVPYYNP